jgi:hypothetical protein
MNVCHAKSAIGLLRFSQARFLDLNCSSFKANVPRSSIGELNQQGIRDG